MYDLIDREISVTRVIATMLWALGLALIGCSFFTTEVFAELGLWVAGLGGVMTIRDCMRAAASREKEAFELGREYEASQRETDVYNVRPMR